MSLLFFQVYWVFDWFVCLFLILCNCVNLSGQITLEEFLAGAQKEPWILNMLRLDMNPYSWVMEQRRKSAHFWDENVSTGNPNYSNISSIVLHWLFLHKYYKYVW